MRKAFVLAAAFIFLCTLAASAETAIKAKVDKDTLTTDEFLAYEITFTCAQKNLPMPKIPGFSGFRVISQSQSSNISVGKEGFAASIFYVFVLSPLETGKLTIEPAEVKVNNKTYSTQAFEIEVAPGKEKPEAVPETSQPESQGPQYTL